MSLDSTADLGTRDDGHAAAPSWSDRQAHPERVQQPLSDDASALIAQHCLTDADLEQIAPGYTGSDEDVLEQPGEATQAPDGSEVEVLHSYPVPREIEDSAPAHVLLNILHRQGRTEAEVLELTDAWVAEQQLAERGFKEYLSQQDRGDQASAWREMDRMWGSQAAANVREIRSYLRTELPPGVGEAILNYTRLPNGVALGNDPQTLAWFLRVARLERRSK